MARYIDAEELELEYYGLSIHGTVAVKSVLPVFVNLLDKQPTADVEEVKHGEWYLLDECANEGVYCSVCHKKVYKTDYANQNVKSKYCPNCGAKMDGKRKENE